MNKRFKGSSLIILSTLLLTTGTSCNINTSKVARGKVYSETENTPLLIGLWVPPVLHLTSTQDEADARYAEIRESNINMAYTHHDETNNYNQLVRALNAAEKNGIKLMVSLPAGNDKASLELVKKTKDYPAVLGYNMADEPGASSFASFGALRDKIKEMVSADKIIMCNLLPNYASDSVLGTTGDLNMDSYEMYIDQYMKIVRPDILSFDHYPFMANTSSDKEKIPLMLRNLCDIRNSGSKYGVDTWGFVQNSSWAGTRIPNGDELRFVSNIHLIFGLSSYSYFLYCQPYEKSGAEGVFEGMLTYSGERTDIYYRVQQQNKDINAMKGVYLNYKNKGFILHNMSIDNKKAIDENLRLVTYLQLKSIESEGTILTGCFEKDGKIGLYVMNFDYTKNTSAKLLLDGKHEYKVWGANGLEQMTRGKLITLDLSPGEGRFVEIE